MNKGLCERYLSCQDNRQLPHYLQGLFPLTYNSKMKIRTGSSLELNCYTVTHNKGWSKNTLNETSRILSPRGFQWSAGIASRSIEYWPIDFTGTQSWVHSEISSTRDWCQDLTEWRSLFLDVHRDHLPSTGIDFELRRDATWPSATSVFAEFSVHFYYSFIHSFIHSFIYYTTKQ